MNRTVLPLAAMCAVAALAAGAPTGGQEPAANGRIEFAVRVTPASGQPEPARGLTIFLLSKSFREIGREAEGKTPRPDLDAYIETLPATRELKDWMKKQRSVTITGDDFRKRLSDDDLFRVPEFLEAYVKGNLLELTLGFPQPKTTPEERAEMSKSHGSYPKVYVAQLRKYLTAHPDTKGPMDTILQEQDATKPWTIEESRWRERSHALALRLAQSDYLASKTVTNLDGLGAFQAAPGKYWLSSLDGEALAGEQRLRWDVAVEARAGGVTRVELSNLNAEGRGGGSRDSHYRAGMDGIGEPVCIFCPTPPYPEEARNKHFQGTVLLELTILPDGTTTDVRVVRGLGMGLDESALGQVREWRFKPVMGPGNRPVPVDLEVEINFRM